MPKRPHLTARTTSFLYHLHHFGAGGTDAVTLAQRAGMRPRQAAARLRWLQRVGLIRYTQATERWQLTDDSMFQPPATQPHHEPCVAED